MRRVRFTDGFYGTRSGGGEMFDLNWPYEEWFEDVQHPPSFNRAKNIAISRLNAVALGSTGRHQKVGLCVLTGDTYPNLQLLKEWLGLAADAASQFLLLVHAKNQDAVAKAVEAANLPIAAIVIGDVATQWSSIGIVEAQLLMFQTAQENDCKGAILMSGDAVPIKHPNILNNNVLEYTVRGGFTKPKDYTFWVGEQWLCFNERGLGLLRKHVPITALYDMNILNKHFEPLDVEELPKDSSLGNWGSTSNEALDVDDLPDDAPNKWADTANLRTARIEDVYEGLAPDETLIHMLLSPHLSPQELKIARGRIMWMQSDENHALEIEPKYLSEARPVFLLARKVTNHQATHHILKKLWGKL